VEAEPSSPRPHTPAPSSTSPAATVRELHENKELEKLFEQVAAFGLSIEDYALTQEEAASGDRLATKYAWDVGGEDQGSGPRAEGRVEDEEAVSIADGEGADGSGAPGPETSALTTSSAKLIEAVNLPSVLATLLQVGRRGLEVKRFKGLGEMDAEELWETTMDAKVRSMLRITWDAASEAERLFTILMGEDVEQRRRYIEEHALEVKNLDV